MALRTHLGRGFSLRHPTHRYLAAICGVVLIAAVYQWATAVEPQGPITFISDRSSPLLAPVVAFLVWALLREIDPDHDWTALTGAAFAGTWILVEGTTVGGLAIAGLMVSGRIVSGTTGRRPLLTDLLVVGVFGAAISFRPEGLVAGLTLATAIVVDDLMAPQDRRLPQQPWIAGAVAVTAALVAVATDVTLDFAPYRLTVVMAAQLLFLYLLLRRPLGPQSLVDARHGATLSRRRLHASRALIGLAVLAIAWVLDGPRSEGVVPLLAALLLAAVSNEIEAIRRTRKV